MYFICLTPEAISKVTINPTEHTEETCRLHTERSELCKEDKTKIQLPETWLTFSDFVFCFCFFLPFVPVRFKCFVCLSPCRRCRRKLTGAGASLPLWLLGNQTTRRWVWVNRRGRPVCQWVRTHSCSLLVRHKDPQPYARTHKVHHQQQARVSISNGRYNLRILSQYSTEGCDNISDDIGKKQLTGRRIYYCEWNKDIFHPSVPVSSCLWVKEWISNCNSPALQRCSVGHSLLAASISYSLLQ